LLKFLIALSVVTLVILGMTWMSNIPLPTYCYKSLILLFAGTAGLYYYLVKIRETRPDFFVQMYLLTIAVKLLAYGAYLGLVIWMEPDAAVSNVVFFMTVYILFTILEVGFLWRKISR
jgi:hypothetical protein